MKGKFLHNRIMADPLEAALALKGFRTFREFPVRPGQRPQSVDLACQAYGRFILFEFERTTDRLSGDKHKAELVGADLLVVVVPHAGMRQRMVAALHRAGSSAKSCPPVQVMTLGAALNWVANNCPMNGRRQRMTATSLPNSTNRTSI